MCCEIGEIALFLKKNTLYKPFQVKFMLKIMNALVKSHFKSDFKKPGNFSVLANVHTPNIGKRAHLLQNFWQTFTLF